MKPSFTLSLLAILFTTASCSDTTSPALDSGTSDSVAHDASFPGDAGELEDAAPEDSPAPATFGITNLEDYQMVSGVVEVEVAPGPLTPTYVALVVDGREVARDESAPFTLSWDTTQYEDGLIWIRAETTDELSESLMLMVLNAGERMTFDTSSPSGVEVIEGTLSVAADGTFDATATDYAWQLPEGYSAIVLVLFWENPLFELQFDVGQGTDHQSGQFAVGGSSNMSPANLWYSLTHRRSALSAGDCYVLVSPRNDESEVIRGQTTGFRLEGYLLR